MSKSATSRRFSEPVPFLPPSGPPAGTSQPKRPKPDGRRSSTSRSPATRAKLALGLSSLYPAYRDNTGGSRHEAYQRLSGLNADPQFSHLGLIDSSTKVKSRRSSLSHVTESLGLRESNSEVVKLESWSPPPSPKAPTVQAYASLPPTPLRASTFSVGERSYRVQRAESESTHVGNDTNEQDYQKRPYDPQTVTELPPFSLWEYLREELLATDFDSHQELKWERVSNFLSIPMRVEKVISFGMLLCFDTFLHTFTILPIRFMLALYGAVASTILRSRPSLPPSQKADILRMLLLAISIAILLPLTDASKIYHSIRGQDTIKLYVIFNALEIADRLLTSIGQDVLDCMFSRSTLSLFSNHIAPTTSTIRPLLFFILSVLYTVSHALILVYQLTALNVAINAYDNALLTLLLSNQFVEIKGSVFKKFEKDNLFQITCADIVERFQLTLMLVSIAMRNLIELSSSELDLSAEGSFVLPVAFKAFRFASGRHIVGFIFSPVITVLISELVVDWLKHAFIAKFNHIRPTVYERYIDVLCRDLTTGSWVSKRRNLRKHNYVDQSPVVARRLGFAALPSAVLAVLLGSQSISLVISTHFSFIETPTLSSVTQDLWDGTLWHRVGLVRSVKWIALGVLIWICMVTVKVIMGINLLAYATRRRAGMEERRREDEEINEFLRPPIGEGREEQAYNKELKTLLNQPRDDALPVAEIGENHKPQGNPTSNASGGGRKKIALEDLTRFTMVKRIW